MSSPSRAALVRGALLASVFLSCSSETKTTTSSSSGGTGVKPTFEQPPATVLFSPSIKNVVVEVDYEVGAAPYVGRAGQFEDVWNLFRTNTTALFEGKKTVSFPTKREDMESFDDVSVSEFTVDDIVTIANAHRTEASSGDTVTFYVVFLNGYFKNAEGVVSDTTLGVSVGTTGVIALFKPAIAATAVPKTAVAQFVEQSTLIHELGHAVGFVNNGVPVNSDHHDAANGAHCTNNQCVMYWANEGAKDAVEFVRRYIIGGDPVLYGQECLSDARILENKLQP